MSKCSKSEVCNIASQDLRKYVWLDVDIHFSLGMYIKHMEK